MSKIDIDKLALEVITELQEYGKVTIDAVTEAVQETAKMTAVELRDTSPKLTGDYANSWSYKRDEKLKGKYRYDMVVYEKKPEYRLTHLLEKGYQHRYGGRVPGQPHIKNAEKHARENLEERIKKKL